MASTLKGQLGIGSFSKGESMQSTLKLCIHIYFYDSFFCMLEWLLNEAGALVDSPNKGMYVSYLKVMSLRWLLTMILCF